MEENKTEDTAQEANKSEINTTQWQSYIPNFPMLSFQYRCQGNSIFM